MRGIRLGRLFGIDLRIDASWILIFLLLTWNLVAVFGRWHPGWSSVEALGVAVCASLLFFGCVVLHELAHSLVATRFGLKVRSITLFLFGGVSNIEHEPPSAKAEFLTAIVGPLTSVALGVIFLAIASATTPRLDAGSLGDADAMRSQWAQLGPVETLLAWLGPVNVVIGVFNLIPGFPLDGGRVLRSILWKAMGSLRKATLAASTVGQVIGWIFIACGVAMAFGVTVPFWGKGLVGGIWLAFIGWFLHSAAARANNRVALDEVLGGMTVAQFMRRDVAVAAPGLTLSDLLQKPLMFADDHTLPVADHGHLLGLVNVTDLRRVPSDRWQTTPVEAVMRGADTIETAAPTDPLATAFERLSTQDVDEMPVIDHGDLVGIVRRRDVARWLGGVLG